MKRNATMFTTPSMVFVIMLTLVSCYKFGIIAVPTQIEGNATFNSRITAINDGNNGPQTGLSFFAVRVPENWNVFVGAESYVQYAIEGTLNDKGEPVNLKAAMRYNSVLADMLNMSNPKEGYTWFAFQTKECIRRSIQGSANNGADSVCFDYKVTNDGVPGTYELDYMMGTYETQNPNVLEEELRYKSDDVEGSDIYRVGTEQVKFGKGTFNTVDASFKRSITVLDGGTPVDNSPKLSVVPNTTDVEITYSNLSGNIQIFKDASTVGVNADFNVISDQKLNSGKYSVDITNYEPGVYHVRHSSSNAETTFTIKNRTFTPNGASLFVIGSTGMLAPQNLLSEGKAFEKSREGDANLYEMSSTIIKAMIDSVLLIKPQIVLFTGDMTMNGDAESHKLMSNLLKPIKEAGIEVYVVPGDKDINNPHACIYNGDTKTTTAGITSDDFANVYYLNFGYNEAISRDETTLSYIAYPTDKVAILALDASQYCKNGIVETKNEDGSISNDTILNSKGELKASTFEWMNKVVTNAHASGRQVIALTHHLIGAPFDGYSMFGNIINNSQQIDISSMFSKSDSTSVDSTNIVSTLTEIDTQNLFAENGIDVVFVGDANATDITCIKTSVGSNLYQVSTGSAISYGCPYRLLDLSASGVDIQTRLIKNIPMNPSYGRTFEDFAYYRTKEKLYELVSNYIYANWETIDSMLVKNFTFEYNPETDLFNKNDFMNLPNTPEELAANVNNNVIPPLIDVILAFSDGNEDKKKSQELVEGMQRGVDGLINSLNKNPEIVTPLIKEGFAKSGLDIDSMVQGVISSIAYNYVGDPTNVTNDLFFNIPFVNYDPTSIKNTELEKNSKVVETYNLNGIMVRNTNHKGIYINKTGNGNSFKVVVQ